MGVKQRQFGLVRIVVLYYDYFTAASVPRSEIYPVVREFAHGAMGRPIDPSWGGPIELFLVPSSAPRLA